MRRLTSPFIALVVVLMSTPAFAADPSPLDDAAAAIERASKAPDGIRVVVGHLSRELGIPAGTLREQRMRTGLGWGDILIAHRLATAAKLSFEQVINRFRDGKTWEEIARDQNVDVRTLLNAVRESQAAIAASADDKAPPSIHMEGPGRASSAPAVTNPTGVPGTPGPGETYSDPSRRRR
jgi:hypothetical protein